jgi:hypothetical protein
MKLSALVRYLTIKYAENDQFEADTSFGVSINGAKTRILKDKLILIYDKLTKDITNLPAFIDINKKLGDNAHWLEFNRLIINFVNYIEAHDLKKGFSYSTRLIDKLNELRNALVASKIPREQMIELDIAIRGIQDDIWKESKRILNIHDLRGLELKFPELQGILGKVVPTWDYGPGKNPAKGLIKQRRRETVNDLLKRLQKEEE